MLAHQPFPDAHHQIVVFAALDRRHKQHEACRVFGKPVRRLWRRYLAQRCRVGHDISLWLRPCVLAEVAEQVAFGVLAYTEIEIGRQTRCRQEAAKHSRCTLVARLAGVYRNEIVDQAGEANIRLAAQEIDVAEIVLDYPSRAKQQNARVRRKRRPRHAR